MTTRFRPRVLKKNIKEESRMKKLLFILSAIAIVLLFEAAGVAGETLVTVGAENLVIVDGSTYKLVSPKPATGDPAVTPPPADTGLMWEWSAAKGDWKSCLCRMGGFRALQAVGTFLSIDDFNSSRTSIVTGWNTHGPEELFVENMPWVEGTNFSYAAPITSGTQLTLDDAWFTFTIDGIGTYRVSTFARNYKIDHDTGHPGYHVGWDFFDYRTYYKTHTGMDAEKEYFRDVVRGQIVNNYKGDTRFNISHIP